MTQNQAYQGDEVIDVSVVFAAIYTAPKWP